MKITVGTSYVSNLRDLGSRAVLDSRRNCWVLVDVSGLDHITDIRVSSTSLHPDPPCCRWVLVLVLAVVEFNGLAFFINSMGSHECHLCCKRQ